MSLAGISIRRPVATTMVMVSFIFIGLLAMFSMKKELIPDINIPVVTNFYNLEWSCCRRC
ncbi:Acriflavin resistance plasma membrane protein [Fusobacterium vincentii ATCC 49256]|uniref:Acriflavin resistance plasma membrane protein n=1 Tax=Fusobacterium vincentii ATCC 49256 TaxID=209882 RepID=Q7P4I1_FUSVC|nr:Acriflavin resistance plasma membrane protein [Fusobacterium vincentii ATCC 49256]